MMQPNWNSSGVIPCRFDQKISPFVIKFNVIFNKIFHKKLINNAMFLFIHEKIINLRYENMCQVPRI
jgi:hypothetical protein